MAGAVVKRITKLQVSFGSGATAGSLLDALAEAPNNATVSVEHYAGDQRDPQYTTITLSWEGK